MMNKVVTSSRLLGRMLLQKAMDWHRQVRDKERVLRKQCRGDLGRMRLGTPCVVFDLFDQIIKFVSK